MNENDMLRSLIENAENPDRYLLDCLDAVKNSISIYDKKGRILYANKSFCDDFNVLNRDAIIGMDANDFLKFVGYRIRSTEDEKQNLKMFDVLSSGETVLDWEVRLESPQIPNGAKLCSNDMYPIFDSAGKVCGMVELTHSRVLDISRSRKIVGLSAEYTFNDIIAVSALMREKIRDAKKYADSPFNLLITGESGVGKELFAQSIHNYGPRHKAPFIAVNCANFSDGLIESELFGYVNGAFTGASKNGHIGKFELANGGTLFLDEVGELPFNFQAKLLRVLETRMVTRIGSNSSTPVNIRLIAATNRDLAAMVEEGVFRRDLFYRLQVLTLEIPSLRERPEDILPLSEYLLMQCTDTASQQSPKKISDDAKAFMKRYKWPGNVRELRNAIQRISILAEGNTITESDLERALLASGHKLAYNSSAEEALDPSEKLAHCRKKVNQAYASLIKAALDLSGGNKKKAAAMLDISRNTLYRMIEKYNL